MSGELGPRSLKPTANPVIVVCATEIGNEQCQSMQPLCHRIRSRSGAGGIATETDLGDAAKSSKKGIAQDLA
jgi:hypothetical protein